MNAEKLRNIRIGIFAIVAFIILCWGLSYLKGKDVFSRGFKLRAYFSSVDGLTDSSPVIYNGYKVGIVSDIDIDQFADDPTKVFCVSLSVDKKISVPSDSRVEIVSTDILGGKGIELHIGQSTQMAERDDVIQSGVRVGLLDDLAPLKDKADGLMGSATGVLNSIDSILDKSNRDKLDDAIASLAVVMRNVERITQNLDALTRGTGALGSTFHSADNFLGSLNMQSGKIDTLMSNLATLSTDLSKSGLGNAVQQMDTLLRGANRLFEGEGNIAKLTNDKQLYENLNTTIENLNRLLVDLRLNPSRYINVSAIKFGGKNVYFSDTNTSQDVMSGQIYAICIAESKTPQDVVAKIADKKVYEYYDQKKYKYLILPFSSQAEAENFRQQNNISANYSNVQIELYDNGQKKR